MSSRSNNTKEHLLFNQCLILRIDRREVVSAVNNFVACAQWLPRYEICRCDPTPETLETSSFFKMNDNSVVDNDVTAITRQRNARTRNFCSRWIKLRKI